MRLRLVPQHTEWDFFKYRTLTFGFSVVLMVASLPMRAHIPQLIIRPTNGTNYQA